MQVVAVTIAMSVDFFLGHSEWSYEDIIDVTGKVAEELIMGNDIWAMAKSKITTDKLSVDNGLNKRN